MPNGFTGSRDNWNEAQAALEVVDALIPECFHDRKIVIIENAHEWPSREIEWMEKGLKRKIQVYPSTEDSRAYNVWLCASTKAEGVLLWKREFLRENASWETLLKEIREVLMQAVGIVESWMFEDLTCAPVPRTGSHDTKIS
jgi:hypothetical protein